MKKTNYRKKKDKIITAVSLFVTIFLTILFASLLYISFKDFYKNGYLSPISIMIIIISGLFFIFSALELIVSFTGILKAKKTIYTNTEKIKNNNPYIYYRELPNNYGIGVATLLLDSAIENEKDIVAVILDLCAKGYLNLKKLSDTNYSVTILKPIDDKLLENEKYIINSILNGDIKKFNYDEWFQHCMQDGINLGLFTKKGQENIGEKHFNNRVNKINKVKKVYKTTCLVIAILTGLSVLFSQYGGIIKTLFLFCITYLSLLAVLFVPMYWIPSLIVSFFSIGKETFEQGYNTEISKYLEPTKKGKKELQKLFSFKAFIKDFGLFANKNPEEVVLWEYYLSYAQIFGLTDNILNTGYDKLIKNGSFEIENLDSIKLSELDIIS